jgi:hypothetical protein
MEVLKIMVKKGWSDTKPGTDQAKWQDNLEWYKLKTPKDNVDFNQIRLIGPIMSAVYHWVEITKQDGNKATFPATCCGYDSETETINEDKCPGCLCHITQQKFYFQNAIIRDLQEVKPVNAKSISDFPEELNKPYREVGNKSWSPIRVLKIPVSCAAQLRNIVKLNRHKIAGSITTKDVSDDEYGIDLFIKYDSTETPMNMYDIQKGDCTPLTVEEKQYKLFNLNVVKSDPIRFEKDLIRTGHMDKDSAHFSKLEGDNKGKGSSSKDDESLQVEEDEEASTGEVEDHLTSLDRDGLKKYIVRNNLKDSVKVLRLMSDEDIRQTIRKVEVPKDQVKPTCFGEYKAEASCFTCGSRNGCIDAQGT